MWYEGAKLAEFAKDDDCEDQKKNVETAKELSDGSLLLLVYSKVSWEYTLECWSLEAGKCFWTVDVPYESSSRLVDADLANRFLLVSCVSVYKFECSREKPAKLALAFVYSCSNTCCGCVTTADARLFAIGHFRIDFKPAIALYELDATVGPSKPVRTMVDCDGTETGFFSIVQLSNDTLVTCQGGSQIKIWNFETGRVVRRVETSLTDPRGCRGLRLVDERTLVAWGSGVVWIDVARMDQSEPYRTRLFKNTCRVAGGWTSGRSEVFFVLGWDKVWSFEAVDRTGKRLLTLSAVDGIETRQVGTTARGPLLQTDGGLVLVCLVRSLQDRCQKTISSWRTTSY